MRGPFDSQPMIIAYVNLEKRVPQDHPLPKIKPLADQELNRLSLIPADLAPGLAPSYASQDGRTRIFPRSIDRRY